MQIKFYSFIQTISSESASNLAIILTMKVCCEKASKNKTFLNSLLSTLNCSCEKYEKKKPLSKNDHQELECSFDGGQFDKQTEFLINLLDIYFKKMNKGLGLEKMPPRKKEEESEQLLQNFSFKQNPHLTETELSSFWHVIKCQKQLMEILNQLLTSIDPSLRHDYFFLWVLIIEEFISVPRLSKNFDSDVTNIIKLLHKNTAVIAKKLNTLYPPQCWKKENSEELLLTFGLLVVGCVKSVLSIFEGYFQINPNHEAP